MSCPACGKPPGKYNQPPHPLRRDSVTLNECPHCGGVTVTGDPTPPDQPELAARLVTLGLIPEQLKALAGIGADHITVDLRSMSIGVDTLMLSVLDAADGAGPVVLLIGPAVFGLVCSGQLSDLGGWAKLRTPPVTVVVAVDSGDTWTAGMASEVYVRMGATYGAMLDVPEARTWLLAQLGRSDSDA